MLKHGGKFISVRPGPPQVSMRLKSSSSPPLPKITLPRSRPYMAASSLRRVLASGSG